MPPLTVYVESAARGAKFSVVARLAAVELVVSAGAAPASVLACTPFAQLPTLVTADGSGVARSAAILRYLAGLRDDAELVGRGAYGEAQVDAWLEWALKSLEPVLVLLSPGAGAFLADARDLAAAQASARARVPPLLAALEAHLGARTFVAGERLSLADVALAVPLAGVWGGAAAAGGAGAAFAECAAGPAVTRWFLTCRHHAAFVAVLGPAGAAEGAAGAARGAAAAGGTAAASGGGAAAAAGGFSALDAVGAAGASALVPTGAPTRIEGKFVRGRVRIADLLAAGEEAVGRTVTVCGWARTVREQGAGAMFFVSLHDGTCFDVLQVLAERDKTEGFESIAKCGGTGASFRMVGTVVKSPAKGQAIEVAATHVTVVGVVRDPVSYPLAKKKHTLEYLRDITHLRPRTNTIGAVTRVRNACAYAVHTFFQERGFLYIHTPIITASDCEGAGEMFGVTTLLPADAKAAIPRAKDGSIDYKKDFFGQPTGLTVSGQLQVEAFSCSMSDVYTFGPTFRAENSHTARHLAEFWMIEPEIAFATLAEDMDLAEDFLKYATQWVLDHCAADLRFFEEIYEKGLVARLRNVVAEPFQRLTYTEAIELLSSPKHQAAGKFEAKVYWGVDLASEHERYLTEKVFKKPVILVNYPKGIKSFYMKLNPDGKTVAAMDVLVPKIGEIMGGSQREDDPELLTARMAEMGVPAEPLAWYLDLRRYGTVPHAGFGLGFERLVMYVTGIDNIRDVIPFPRWPGNARG